MFNLEQSNKMLWKPSCSWNLPSAHSRGRTHTLRERGKGKGEKREPQREERGEGDKGTSEVYWIIVMRYLDKTEVTVVNGG